MDIALNALPNTHKHKQTNTNKHTQTHIYTDEANDDESSNAIAYLAALMNNMKQLKSLSILCESQFDLQII